MLKTFLRYRAALIAVFHLALIAAANYLAFWLRFDGSIPDLEWTIWLRMLPWLLLIRAGTFLPFRLYEDLWRYASVWDLRNIILSVACSSVAFYFIVHWMLQLTKYPRSVFIVDALLLIFFMGGVRLGRRVFRDVGRRLDAERRLLIFGAGDAGEMILREIRNDRTYNYEAIGFVDDDPKKVGQRIHGVPVLGTREALPDIVRQHKPDEVLVAIPRADWKTLRGVLQALEPFKIPITTLPNLREIINGKVTVEQIRNLAVEDLLPRAPVGLDRRPLADLISGRRVLITGAGGSIGSELARQIASLSPDALILYERYENGLYQIMSDLAERNGHAPVVPVLGDITDHDRVRTVFERHRPEIVFHAAAHKHVPMMELHPCEAVKNNVTGTRMVSAAAARAGVQKFILISSDKAVNPTSVMGATKRVAELLVLATAVRLQKPFVAVRFGNVLGSNGSVLPRFIEQIRAGGPVTVTHPEICRYFMLISEAVQLVLHAAAAGDAGDLYVLDMGEQIKVVDLARNLIRLSGFVPDAEIPIKFVGLRPGEKLSEELVSTGETVLPSSVERILKVQSESALDAARLAKQVDDLERFAALGDAAAAIRQLRAIVPTFQPGGKWDSALMADDELRAGAAAALRLRFRRQPG